MKNVFLIVLYFIIVCTSCKRDAQNVPIKQNTPSTEAQPEVKEDLKEDTANVKTEPILNINEESKPTLVHKDIDHNQWTELTEADGYELDIRYATTNNFTKKQIYDCAKCYLRPDAAAKIKIIHKELKDKFGYGLKIFDCYRPGPYQQRLWDIVPDPDYVTPPTKGSMHSRGLAIDLTLVDKDGQELDMGTEFDFFGEEAHQGYPKHSEAIKRNRWILKSTMAKHGFGSIRTEWWHYSYKSSHPLDKWIWPCE